MRAASNTTVAHVRVLSVVHRNASNERLAAEGHAVEAIDSHVLCSTTFALIAIALRSSAEASA